MSRTPASYSMTVVRGATWEDEFTYRDENGQAIDLTGFEARMQVRTLAGEFGTSGADTLVMELSTVGPEARLQWDTAATGRVRIAVSAADTALLNPDNLRKVKLAYSLEFYRPTPAPEYVLPIVAGKITVRGETTR